MPTGTIAIIIIGIVAVVIVTGIVGAFSVDKAGDVAVNPNLAQNVDAVGNAA